METLALLLGASLDSLLGASLDSLLGASLDAGTALALAGLGLLINERAGVVNLGAEGMMLVAAIAGFASAFHTGSDLLGLLAGALAAALLALGFGLLTIYLHANQYAAGLALSLLGGGLSAFVGTDYTQRQLGERSQFALPLLRDLPWVGRLLFQHHPVVYATVALGVGLAYFFARTRSGLVLRAIGEAPESAFALGYPVQRIRLLAVVAGGALCGCAGAYLSIVYTPLWVEGMVAGKGWIALALTTFATWRPLRVLLGAYLFGGLTMLQFTLQAEGIELASQWLSMLPYLATVLVLALISQKALVRVHMPASLGKPFFPSS